MGFLPGFPGLVAEIVTLGRYFSESKFEGAGSALVNTFLSALAADLAECVSETGDEFSDLATALIEDLELFLQFRYAIVPFLDLLGLGA